MKKRLFYLFIRKGKFTYSRSGEACLKCNNHLASVESFFTRERQADLSALLKRIENEMVSYREVCAHDYALNPLEYDDPCMSFPIMASNLVARPEKNESEVLLAELFLTMRQQQLILSAKNLVLNGTIIWWGRRINQVWKDCFGCLPSVIDTKLACKL